MAGLLVQNTLGDRKEIWGMLHRLSPLDRLRFLCECCVLLKQPGIMASARNMPLREARRDDGADTRVTDAIYMDLLYFATQHKMDLDATVSRLAGYVARPAALRENHSLRQPLADALRVGRAFPPR